jgi:hypothetical protein
VLLLLSTERKRGNIPLDHSSAVASEDPERLDVGVSFVAVCFSGREQLRMVLLERCGEGAALLLFVPGDGSGYGSGKPLQACSVRRIVHGSSLK